MRKVNYNFSGFLDIFDDMISEYDIHCRIKESQLNDLRKELNRFFSDSKCQAVVFTENDGLFFGMCVHPELTPQFISAVLENDDERKHRIDSYRIEIDSRIFSGIDITPDEMLAMVLHEVGHIVNDTTLYEEMCDVVNIYAAKNHVSIQLPDGEKERSLAMSILKYGFNNTIRKTRSMFCIYKDGEVLADHFVYECGYLDSLQSLFKKVTKNGINMANNVANNKLVALTWSIKLMMDIKFKRNTAVHSLIDAMRVTQSKFEKIDIKTCIDKLKRYSTDDGAVINVYESVDLLLEQDYIEESKEAEIRKSNKRKAAILRGVAPYEEDYYELVMQARSLGDKNNALFVLRQVNQRISVLEDVLENVELSTSEAKKFMTLLDKYRDLRFDLAHNAKFKYDYSNSVIQIAYPEL